MSEIPRAIGRYAVERLFGEGGMGLLYLAHDPVLDRRVALKLLRVDGDDLRRGLMREAQSAGRLQHPHIVTIYDVGEHEGQLYIAMEYIDGDTLATLIREGAPFSALRKLDVIDEVADGLGYAHQRGLIHRDIKPANLMVSRAGLVKVLDFGIARMDRHSAGDTDGTKLTGTPAYMAPEQLEGAPADARSDIYAVGLVMYELFSGRRAFGGATTADVLQQVLAAQPIPIEELVPDIDPDLARIIARAMARLPADRYPDLQAMRKDLARPRRRAMQASGDDATVMVAAPGTRPVPAPAVAGAAAAVPITVNLPLAPSDAPSTSAVAMHDQTVWAPVVAAAAAPVPAPVLDRVLDPVATPVPTPAPAAVVPPPLPSPRARPMEPQAMQDEGPLPVALPAVSSSLILPSTVGGRAAVEVPLLPAVGHRAASAAPPPVAPPGVVQSAASGSPATPIARRGIPAAVIVGGLVAMLAVCFVLAFVAVRSFGLFSGASLSGLFTTSVEPRVVGPSPAPPAATEVAVEQPATPVAVTPVADAPPTQTTVETPAPAAPPPPAVAVEVPARRAEGVTAPVTVPPKATPSAIRPPPPVTPAVPRQSPAVRDAHQTRPAAPAPLGAAPGREAPAQVARDDTPAPVAEPAPRPVQRQEPPPAAPEEEGLLLVRAYVAARNTAHASGIRRVWPDVDDGHLRRVTTAFSAPLTLAGCTFASRDSAHAVATCQLTQPGTTGAFAGNQGLTIRRTFVFDLVRQGRAWVIAGLRD